MNDLRIFARRSFTGSITYDVIRKSSAAYFIPFFRGDVELLMRAYIAFGGGIQTLALPCTSLLFSSSQTEQIAFQAPTGAHRHANREHNLIQR
jgi:hypothetical protein